MLQVIPIRSVTPPQRHFVFKGFRFTKELRKKQKSKQHNAQTRIKLNVNVTFFTRS